MPGAQSGIDFLLAPYRVLDLTDDRGLLCGKILADLGADVLPLEPPGGSPARNIGPFYGDAPRPEKSLFWWAYAANKRSITLDLEQKDGRALLEKLLAEADFPLDANAPGYLDALGLGHGRLAVIHPTSGTSSLPPVGPPAP